MICQQCKKPITGKNHGRFTGSEVVNLCSVQCRADNLNALPPAATPGNVATGKTGKRSLKAVKGLKSPGNAEFEYSEAAISKAISKHLDLIATFHTRLQSGAIQTGGERWVKLCTPGTPDRMACLYGFIVFFEVKATGLRATPEQIEVGKKLKDVGALWFQVDSFERYLKITQTIKNLVADGYNYAPDYIQIEIDEALPLWEQNRK